MFLLDKLHGLSFSTDTENMYCVPPVVPAAGPLLCVLIMKSMRSPTSGSDALWSVPISPSPDADRGDIAAKSSPASQVLQLQFCMI